MTLKNNRPVIVGIFISSGIAILVVLIFTLGGQKKTFVKSITMNAIFDDAGGLLEGGNIWFSGVKVGTVKKISFYGNAQVLVKMSIVKEAWPQIHTGAKARIGSDGLIGNKIVIIYGGNYASNKIPADGFLEKGKALSTDDIMETLQANNNNLLIITSDFRKISKKIDTGNGLLAMLLNDPSLINKVNKTLANLEFTSANLKVMATNGNILVSNLDNFSNKLNKPGNSINEIVSDTTVYPDIKETLLQLQHSANAIALFTADLSATSQKLNKQGNTVSLLVSDTAFSSSIKSTLKNLQSSSLKLDQDLEALQHNFLLRAFFKKKTKE